MTKGWHLGLLAVVAAPLLGSAVQASPLSPLTTIFGTDFVVAGTGGMRGTGAGTITVGGVSGTVNRSDLFWHGPTNSTDPNANANVTVNGNAVTGTNIGFSDDNFWGFANSQAYRATTTAIINGSGVYNLSGFTKAGVEVNGAATALFFQDGSTANDRDVIVYQGNDSNFESPFDAAGWSITLNSVQYTAGSAFLTLFVSDGQNFGSTDDGTLRINGTPLATGGLFQGNTLPGGTGPTGNGNLFDIRTYDITAFLTPGLNNLLITLDSGVSDALSTVAAFVDLPAGAAPPIAVPEPSAMMVLLSALAGLGLMRRRA